MEKPSPNWTVFSRFPYELLVFYQSPSSIGGITSQWLGNQAFIGHFS